MSARFPSSLGPATRRRGRWPATRLTWIVTLALVGCREVPPDAPPPSRAEQMRARGAALARERAVRAPELPPVLSAAGPLSPTERADVEAIGAVVGGGTDAVQAALVAVDEAVERDLPVRASELLRATALPASDTRLARLQAIEPSSELGVALHRLWLDAETRRKSALGAYAAALERGIVEDLVLADALRDQRLAGDALQAARHAHAAAQRRIDASAEGE